jgi:hypothetical protein
MNADERGEPFLAQAFRQSELPDSLTEARHAAVLEPGLPSE